MQCTCKMPEEKSGITATYKKEEGRIEKKVGPHLDRGPVVGQTPNDEQHRSAAIKVQTIRGDKRDATSDYWTCRRTSYDGSI